MISSLALLLVTACATTPPLNLSGADPTLTPDAAVTNIDSARGRRVAWGGTIVATHNLKDITEIEVLGYPLQESGQPDVETKAQHRFLIIRKGYLESADYRAGRLLTAVGDVTGTRNGKVGEAPYVYPVLQADDLYLWPTENAGRGKSNVQFGIGIGVIFH